MLFTSRRTWRTLMHWKSCKTRCNLFYGSPYLSRYTVKSVTIHGKKKFITGTFKCILKARWPWNNFWISKNNHVVGFLTWIRKRFSIIFLYFHCHGYVRQTTDSHQELFSKKSLNLAYPYKIFQIPQSEPLSHQLKQKCHNVLHSEMFLWLK